MQINVDGAFCSASRMILAPLSSLNEGIGVINAILQRELLCRHDVEYINRVYNVMQELSDFDRKKVLQELAPRMQLLSQGANSKHKISFHYMQILGHNDLRMRKEQGFSFAPHHLEGMASLLPICSNEEQFENDVEKLIGMGSTGRVKQILNEKRERIKQLQEKKRIISSKTVELEALKRRAPNTIPDYMSELLENGHIQLFDHLIAMRALPERNTRKLAITNLTFSEISHIVLQTRDAIIQKVESSILHHNGQVLFLLGPSGAGKSTTLCSLRGDVMIFEKGRYVSQNDSKIQGHFGSSSCTFLPTVEHVKGCVIVDFPGFEDTNGPLVSLGMECALKALVEKLNPSILVLEPITDREGRFAHVAQLAHMLGRLFNDRTKCVLGITKYSNDSDYTNIQILERIEREKLLAPNPEEEKLIIEINCLKKYKVSDQVIAEKEKELADIRSCQAKKELLIIDTPEIQAHTKTLKDNEAALIDHSGMKKVVRLQNLEDPQQAAQIFSEIMMLSEPVSVCKKHQLDPQDRELLDTIFMKTLFAEIEKEDYGIEYKNFYTFERSILESSLTKTLKGRSNPEIGRFLHLPQLDPKIVRQYDQEIVDRCITKYMNFVIKTIHISLIDKLCNEKSEIGSKQKIDELQKKITKLKNYVLLSLTGLSFVDDPEKAAEKWNEIQKKLRDSTLTIQVQLPAWANFFKISNTAINKIYAWLEGRIQQKAYLQAYDDMIDECCTEVDNMYDALQRLNDIKKMIEKQNDIDDAFSSVKISMQSFSDFHQSIQQRTMAVANVYGNKDWDKRVDFIVEKLSLKGFNPEDENHLNCLLGYAYWLIEPDVQCIYQVEIVLGVVESVNEAVKKMAEELQDIQSVYPFMSMFPFMKGDLSWESIGSNFKRIACSLRKIESAAHHEIELGIEFFAQNENITQSEILRSFANAVGDAASFAENLGKPYDGDADVSTLRKKIDIAYSLAKLNAPAKALVSSWSSWSKALTKGAQLDLTPKEGSNAKVKAKKLFNYKLTLLKKVGSLKELKVDICSNSGMFELDKGIRERHNTNRPLIRALFAAALLKVYDHYTILPDL